MYIGEASKKSGLSIKTIRFYEQSGLLRPALRQGNYRIYNDEDIDIFVLIKEAKDLGVTLVQMKKVIVYKNGQVDWPIIKAFLTKMRKQMLDNISELQSKIAQLDVCYQQIK